MRGKIFFFVMDMDKLTWLQLLLPTYKTPGSILKILLPGECYVIIEWNKHTYYILTVENWIAEESKE